MLQVCDLRKWGGFCWWSWLGPGELCPSISSSCQGGGQSGASLLFCASAGGLCHLLGVKGQDTGKAIGDLAFEAHCFFKHPGGLL